MTPIWLGIKDLCILDISNSGVQIGFMLLLFILVVDISVIFVFLLTSSCRGTKVLEDNGIWDFHCGSVDYILGFGELITSFHFTATRRL